MEINDLVFGLTRRVKELNAGSGHMEFHNVKHTEGLTAVLSVYDGIKPANMILVELYEWAKDNNEEVKLLIEKLEKDMSWNEENLV